MVSDFVTWSLQGLFKNTEDTPVILDDDGPPPSQPSQDDFVEDKGKGRKKSKPRKRVQTVEETTVMDQDEGLDQKQAANYGPRLKSRISKKISSPRKKVKIVEDPVHETEREEHESEQLQATDEDPAVMEQDEGGQYSKFEEKNG